MLSDHGLYLLEAMNGPPSSSSKKLPSLWMKHHSLSSRRLERVWRLVAAAFR